MPQPSKASEQPPRKSSKVIPLTVLGVLSVMVVGYCAAVDDDEQVTADCILLEGDPPPGYGDFTATPTASPTPTASGESSSPTPSPTSSASSSPTPTDGGAPLTASPASSASADGYLVVDDSYCDDDGSSTRYRYYDDDDYHGGHGRPYTGSHGAYVWYYGGRRVGNRVMDGTTLKPSNVTINSRSGKSIQRGGFGGRGWGTGS